MKKTAKHTETPLREFKKLMEVEDVRDQARRLEDERIAFARKQREMAQMTRVGSDVHGWKDKNL